MGKHTTAPTVESRIRPKGGFEETPGKLSTLSKSNAYPKPEKPPARKLRKIANLRNPLGRFDGLADLAPHLGLTRVGPVRLRGFVFYPGGSAVWP